MLLNLRQIRSAHERIEQRHEPRAFASDDTFRIVAPVDLSFDIYKDKDAFRLVGSVRTRLELPCSRCLEPLELPIDTPFDLRYEPHSRNTGEDEHEIEADDLTTAFYDNDAIDLGQLMREQFYLSLPMKPLCRDDCRGLCPVCGTNLNRSTCQCAREWEDPRLAPLGKLKKTITLKRES